MKLNYDGSRLARVWGQPLSWGESPADSARQFLLSHAEVFGVLPENLVAHSLLADQRAEQPVMYDRETGEYRFTLVYYTQYYAGLEVFRSDVRLLVRNEPGYPLVLAASSLRDLGDFAGSPTALAGVKQDGYLESSLATAMDAVLADKPELTNFREAKGIIWAGVDDMQVEPRVAITFVADDAP